MFATGGGNILAFWRPWPPSDPSDPTEWEQENHCLLYGHLGGVMYLTTNTLGDTLVSVGQDRVAKLWRAKPQMSHNSPAILQPVRQPFTSLLGHSLTLWSFQVVLPELQHISGEPLLGQLQASGGALHQDPGGGDGVRGEGAGREGETLQAEWSSPGPRL